MSRAQSITSLSSSAPVIDTAGPTKGTPVSGVSSGSTSTVSGRHAAERTPSGTHPPPSQRDDPQRASQGSPMATTR
ncbi:MAG: hypothetical protein R3A52_28170 [Polyangiales bacterium]